MIVKELAVADPGAHQRRVTVIERKHMKRDPPMQQKAGLEFSNYLPELGVATRCIRQCCIPQCRGQGIRILESEFCE
jgi:hypothetical protein